MATRCRTVVLLLAFLGLCLSATGAGAGPPRVGGPCAYAEYPGTAAILAVTPAGNAAGTADVPYPPYAVTFAFTPRAPLAGEPLYQPGKTHTLTLVNGMPPGPRFLAKYGIAPGRRFACVLKVIRQGTCTPALFDFPDIDRTDYFELQP